MKNTATATTAIALPKATNTIGNAYLTKPKPTIPSRINKKSRILVFLLF
jgi:hypothetical protein